MINFLLFNLHPDDDDDLVVITLSLLFYFNFAAAVQTPVLSWFHFVVFGTFQRVTVLASLLLLLLLLFCLFVNSQTIIAKSNNWHKFVQIICILGVVAPKQPAVHYFFFVMLLLLRLLSNQHDVCKATQRHVLELA